MKHRQGGWFGSMSGRGKLGVALKAPLLVLAIGCLSLLWVQRDLMTARQASMRSLEAAGQFEALRSAALQQQASLRGYLLGGQADGLDDYRKSVSEFDAQAQTLFPLAARNPGQRERASTIGKLMARWRAEVAEPGIAALAQSGSGTLASPPNLSIDDELMTAVEQSFRSAIRQERALLAQRQSRAQQLELLSNGLLVLLLVVGGASSLLAVRSLRRHVVQPLSEFAELIPRLEQGEAADIPYRDHAGDVGALALGFERMRDAMARRRERDWVGIRSQALRSALLPCASEAEFCDTLAREICRALGAGYALAYRWDERVAVLELTASHGLADASATRREYRLDEDPVGLCMGEQGRIGWAPGTIAGIAEPSPHGSILLPLVVRDQRLGVVIVGLVRELEPRQLKLTDEVRLSVALAWSALSRELRVRELVEHELALEAQVHASEDARRELQGQFRATSTSLSELADKFGVLEQALLASEEVVRERTDQLRTRDAELGEQTQKLLVSESERRELEQALRVREEALDRQRLQLADIETAHDALTDTLGARDESLAELGRQLAAAEARSLGLKQDLQSRDESLDQLRQQIAAAEEIRSALTAYLHARDAVLEEQAAKLKASEAEARGLALELRARDESLEQHGRRLTALNADLDARAASALGLQTLNLELHARIDTLQAQAGQSQSPLDTDSDRTESLLRAKAALEEQALLLQATQKELDDAREALIQNAAAGQGSGPSQGGSLASSADLQTVLIVCSDVRRAEVLAQSVRSGGMEVLIARSSGEALGIVLLRRVTGVLLDPDLAQGSAALLRERLLRDPRTQSIPVHEIGRAEGFTGGAMPSVVAFLQKPATRATLLKALECLGDLEAGARKRILVVDRDPLARALVARALSGTPLQLTEAYSATEALRALTARSFDCILLDPDQPDVSDVPFLVEASKQGPLPPVVIYSRREPAATGPLRLSDGRARASRAIEGLDSGSTRFIEDLPRPEADS
ncbi:MAG: CHASE3 domain-containing protein [Panacagrimonas sp.]